MVGMEEWQGKRKEFTVVSRSPLFSLSHSLHPSHITEW